MLCGVFFISVVQVQVDVVVDQLSIWQCFVWVIKIVCGELFVFFLYVLLDGNCSYFLYDLLIQFIFCEVYLVELNFQWVWCYCLLCFGGYLLVLVLVFLLWQGMQISQQINGDYLNEISVCVIWLDGEVKVYIGKLVMVFVLVLLDSVRELFVWLELDLDVLLLIWCYGLYSVLLVIDSVVLLYNCLLD